MPTPTATWAKARPQAALGGARMLWPVVASSLTTAAFLPLMMVSGIIESNILGDIPS